MVRPRLPAGIDYVVVVRSGEPPRGGDGGPAVEATVAQLAARVTGRPGYAAAAPATPPARGRGGGEAAMMRRSGSSRRWGGPATGRPRRC